jgi:4-diphosphocytidyl-2-C-methyl-D-erythritol kinase
VSDLLEIAYAKINLALHVRRRRSDGYHDIETLFAYLNDGDQLYLEPAQDFELQFSGEFGDEISKEAIESNLITRAARALFQGDLPKIRVTLTKNLPIAAGLGGGSADAAAMLRILARYFDRPIGDAEANMITANLGADVPSCYKSIPVIGRGIGIELEPVQNDVTGLACILVNPRIPLPTAPVFQEWNGIDLSPLPFGSACEIMITGRNDLETPAIALCPQIEEVLEYLRGTKPLIARMSGSGATCFAIYEDTARAADIARYIEGMPRDWWAMAGKLK